MEEKRITTRPEVIENFNLNCIKACGTEGAPLKVSKADTHDQGRKETTVEGSNCRDERVRFAKKYAKLGKHGLIVGLMYTSTDPVVNDALTEVNSMMVANKFWPRKELMDQYSYRKCTIRLQELLGNITPHLSARETADGIEDFHGLLEPLRVFGNYNISRKFIENANFPLMHEKFWVGLVRDSKGIFQPKDVIFGSANDTKNATTSIESLVVCEDAPKLAKYYYDRWAFITSWSESISPLNRSLFPQLTWNKKPQKNAAVVCPKCSSKGNSSQTWHEVVPDEESGKVEIKKVLWCQDCGQMF